MQFQIFLLISQVEGSYFNAKKTVSDLLLNFSNNLWPFGTTIVANFSNYQKEKSKKNNTR